MTTRIATFIHTLTHSSTIHMLLALARITVLRLIWYELFARRRGSLLTSTTPAQTTHQRLAASAAPITVPWAFTTSTATWWVTARLMWSTRKR